jgi:hypothetical protein
MPQSQAHTGLVVILGRRVMSRWLIRRTPHLPPHRHVTKPGPPARHMLPRPSLITPSAAFTVTRPSPQFMRHHLLRNLPRPLLTYLSPKSRILKSILEVPLGANSFPIRPQRLCPSLLNIRPKLCLFRPRGPLVMGQWEITAAYLAPSRRQRPRILVHDLQQIVGLATDMPQHLRLKPPSCASMAILFGILTRTPNYPEILPLDSTK